MGEEIGPPLKGSYEGMSGLDATLVVVEEASVRFDASV